MEFLNIRTIKNVLVLAPDKHMGDLVLSLSAINALKECFKGKRFYLVVDSAYSEIIETIDGLDNLILYHRKLLNGNPFIKRLAIQFAFFRQLRNTSPDIAIDLQGGVASSTMTFLSGSPVRVGRSTAKRPYFYNLKVKPSGGKHKVHNCIEIASAVVAQSKIEIYRIRASESKISDLKSILLREGITIKKPIICIHPGAGVIYKQWTTEGFVEISDWLSSRGFDVVFIGSKDEAKRIEEIRAFLKEHTYNLAGKLTLGELVALFEISSLYIGNDSGPMHLASANGAPVIALFGPANEKRWGPLSEQSVVLRGEEPCRKCKGKDCRYDFRCIKTLSPADVKVAIERLLVTTQVDRLKAEDC